MREELPDRPVPSSECHPVRQGSLEAKEQGYLDHTVQIRPLGPWVGYSLDLEEHLRKSHTINTCRIHEWLSLRSPHVGGEDTLTLPLIVLIHVFTHSFIEGRAVEHWLGVWIHQTAVQRQSQPP